MKDQGINYYWQWYLPACFVDQLYLSSEKSKALRDFVSLFFSVLVAIQCDLHQRFGRMCHKRSFLKKALSDMGYYAPYRYTRKTKYTVLRCLSYHFPHYAIHIANDFLAFRKQCQIQPQSSVYGILSLNALLGHGFFLDKGIVEVILRDISVSEVIHFLPGAKNYLLMRKVCMNQIPWGQEVRLVLHASLDGVVKTGSQLGVDCILQGFNSIHRIYRLCYRFAR